LHNHQKKIAVINDFCGFGRCSITVSVPIISAMKIQCCPLPTSVFSNHTGYDSFYYTDFTNHMRAYIDEWKKLNLCFNGILVGFLGSVEQINIVKSFFESFKTDDTVIVLDPIMGDNGTLYPTYSKELSEQMKYLVPYADILTPNLTEACILTGTKYHKNIDENELYEICVKLNGMGPEKIIISGIERGENLENFIFEKGQPSITVAEHKVGPCRAGTGDVFSSIIAADTVNGKNLTDSVKHASSFIAKVLRRTTELLIPAQDGICFEEFLSEI